MSPDGSTVAVVNVPDQRVELFAVGDDGLVREASVRVGIEPIALAFRGPEELWVVNHLSDSVSVVSLAEGAPVVARTLHVGDEPQDIVFAGPMGGLLLSRPPIAGSTHHTRGGSSRPRG